MSNFSIRSTAQMQVTLNVTLCTRVPDLGLQYILASHTSQASSFVYIAHHIPISQLSLSSEGCTGSNT